MFVLLHIVVFPNSSKRDKNTAMPLVITSMNIILSPPETSLQNREY